MWVESSCRKTPRHSAAKEDVMSHKPVRSQYTVIAQLCHLIPVGLVAKVAREHGIDKVARTFSAWSHIVALLHAQLVHALSLNDVCDSLRNHASRLFAIRGATPPAKNTLSHANRTRDPGMAEDLFWEVLGHLTRAIPRFGGKTYKGMPRRFKRAVNIVDASTIQLVANCMDWARHRRRKAAAKLHLMLNLQSFLPRFVVIDTARENDKVRARPLCDGLREGEIVIFDKEYVDFCHFNDLDERGVFWITRSKDNMRSRCVKRRLKRPEGKILRDDEIVLTGKLSYSKYPRRFRLVRALVEVDGKEREMTFMTNNLEWAASSICDLYKCRWAIELFFKEIKQTLQLCDFLGYNKNAILWQVWTALLLYVLLRAIGFVHRWSFGFKRLFCLLRACAWDLRAIAPLLKVCGTARGGIAMRGAAHQAWLPGFAPN